MSNPEFFHRVVDCQYACPAHTPVPEYIRLIAEGRYADAYLLNWEANVFPGILGRVCDRPCEPACRRGRVEDQPVAICRLKRVAADLKGEVRDRLRVGQPTTEGGNGYRVALIGAGPASLTVARDLGRLGYALDLFDEQSQAGGMMRSEIPDFRLPESVIDEEVGYVLTDSLVTHLKQRVSSLKAILERNYDAVFIGTGAPRGRDLDLPGRQEAAHAIHVGIDWLASVNFGHTRSIGKKVLVLGGGNTAMDCCRTARRLGGEEVHVVVRSPFTTMKASPWEKEDALHEGIPITDNHVPLAFIVEDGELKGMKFEKVRAVLDEQGKRRLIPTGEEPVFLACDEVLIAIGQDNCFPWIERGLGIEFDSWDMPVVDRQTLQTGCEKVFIGGDAAFGPQNIITAVAHGHQAAQSIDLFCRGQDLHARPAPFVTLASQKMGVHEWLYDNHVVTDARHAVPAVSREAALADYQLEVELGFDRALAKSEALRCLNCDVQTVFEPGRCFECDSCMDICPTSCISFIPNGDEQELRTRLTAPAMNPHQVLQVSSELSTHRVMVKDENVCLHCGLCAERCPNGAWDMQKFTYRPSYAGAQDKAHDQSE
jgi:NADPH-dependent glutamate synthase beta subunit-like oxidoreductase/ferredoxin